METIKTDFFLKYKFLWTHNIKNLTKLWGKKSGCDLTRYYPSVCLEGQRRPQENVLNIVTFLFKKLEFSRKIFSSP